MSTENLSLYQYPGCIFCARVQDAMARLSLSVELRDIHADGRYRDELVAATGRETVPVLRIEQPSGEVNWLPESLDIIDYLEREVAGR